MVEAQLMTFTILGPWQLPSSMYSQLDAMEAERVIPNSGLKRCISNKERRRRQVGHMR